MTRTRDTEFTNTTPNPSFAMKRPPASKPGRDAPPATRTYENPDGTVVEVVVPDIPDTVTLTYSDGRTVSMDVASRREHVHGVVWGAAVNYLMETRLPIYGEPEDPTWVARAYNPERAAKICRWVDGQLVCS